MLVFNDKDPYVIDGERTIINNTSASHSIRTKSKKKLTKSNIHFLKSLGFKIKTKK